MDKEVKNLISLREATKYCDYSQGYLAFLARQGKLKAIKVGKKTWVTKKEWLKECLTNVKKYG